MLATGSRVFPFSTTDAGAGNAVKLAGNFLIASAIESIGEALALAEAQGLDRTQVCARRMEGLKRCGGPLCLLVC